MSDPPTASVLVTDNFRDNLRAIRAFTEQELEAPGLYARLLEGLEEVIASLERFPRLGSDFLDRRADGFVTQRLQERLRERLHEGETVRQLSTEPYLVLYLEDGETVHLLAIRHHRQLSYDFKRHWSS